MSGVAEKPDLQNQKRVLGDVRAARGLVEVVWVEEVGGGLNLEPPKFLDPMDRVERGEASHLVIAHREGLTRFGYPRFERFASQHGRRLLVLDDDRLGPERESVEDLMTIVHCFSRRLYGREFASADSASGPSMRRRWWPNATGSADRSRRPRSRPRSSGCARPVSWSAWTAADMRRTTPRCRSGTRSGSRDSSVVHRRVMCRDPDVALDPDRKGCAAGNRQRVRVSRVAMGVGTDAARWRSGPRRSDAPRG